MPIISPLPLYSGPEAHLVVHRIGQAKIVAQAEPSGGHFSFGLAAGRYAVKAYVTRACWYGETGRVSVAARRFSYLALQVENRCVAQPDRAGAG